MSFTGEFINRLPVFRIEELQAARLSAASHHLAATASALRHQIDAGRLLKIRRGLYLTIPPGLDAGSVNVDPFVVASRLSPDAVVAYHGALQFFGKARTPSHRITCFTTRRVRPFTFRGFEYVPVLMPPPARGLSDLASGIESLRRQGVPVRVTSLARTMVDVLDAPRHGEGWEEIWQSLEAIGPVDLDFVVLYAIRLGCALTVARVGFYLEQRRDELGVEERYLDALRRNAPRQALYLDQRREPGRLAPAWNLIVPERLIARAW